MVASFFSRKHKLFHRALKLIQLNITSALNQIKMLKGQTTFWYIYYTDVILLCIVLGHDLRSLEPWKTIQVTSEPFDPAAGFFHLSVMNCKIKPCFKQNFPAIAMYLFKAQVCCIKDYSTGDIATNLGIQCILT